MGRRPVVLTGLLSCQPLLTHPTPLQKALMKSSLHDLDEELVDPGTRQKFTPRRWRRLGLETAFLALVTGAGVAILTRLPQGWVTLAGIVTAALMAATLLAFLRWFSWGAVISEHKQHLRRVDELVDDLLPSLDDLTVTDFLDRPGPIRED